MTWNFVERRRRERNYRLMFRVALALFALGILLIIVGVIDAMAEANTVPFGLGLLVTSLAGISAYLTANSTVKIIEQDTSERRGH